MNYPTCPPLVRGERSHGSPQAYVNSWDRLKGRKVEVGSLVILRVNQWDF